MAGGSGQAERMRYSARSTSEASTRDARTAGTSAPRVSRRRISKRSALGGRGLWVDDPTGVEATARPRLWAPSEGLIFLKVVVTP
jgi:hypothetical protein